MGLKSRAKRENRSNEVCVGCTREIEASDEDSVVEVRVGTLRARPRRAKFQSQRRWGLMHERCFAMAMGLSEV